VSAIDLARRNIELIDQTVRFALDAAFHVVCEGILFTGHYGEMLRELCADHLGATFVHYLDVPFAETVRRHASRPAAAEFTPAQMREWFADDDLLGVAGERGDPGVIEPGAHGRVALPRRARGITMRA